MLLLVHVRGVCLGVCVVFVGRVCVLERVLAVWGRESIARSALLSGYLGKSVHLPRFQRNIRNMNIL